MKKKQIEQLANWLRYGLLDMKNQFPYTQRKGLAIGIRDRRNGKIEAIYSTYLLNLATSTKLSRNSKIEAFAMFKEGQLVKVKNGNLNGFIGTIKITTSMGALIFFPALGYTDYVFFNDLESVVNSTTN